MITIKKFTFNPFQENTYILFDETKECVIIDPGCYQQDEKYELLSFIKKNKLKPVHLLNTHCHIDHVLGNFIIANKYDLKLAAHRLEEPILEGCSLWGSQYGINGDLSPKIDIFIEEFDNIEFGNTKLEVIFIPGHSPGHVAFINHDQKFVINGDALFKGSFGRYDLPGGDLATLSRSIQTKIFTLPEDYKVYTGHMGDTTIGQEKKTNPILEFGY